MTFEINSPVIFQKHTWGASLPELICFTCAVRESMQLKNKDQVYICATTIDGCDEHGGSSLLTTSACAICSAPLHRFTG